MEGCRYSRFWETSGSGQNAGGLAILLRAGQKNLIPASHMQKIRVTSTIHTKGVEIDIQFKALSQLLDDDDPTPLPSRELTEFAEETIAGYLDEHRLKSPVELKIEIPEKDLSPETSRIPDAVRHHFSFRVPDLNHELVLSRREGMYSFIIATFNAIIAVLFLTAYYDEYALGNLPFLLLTGLITILNWVTIWDTYEYFMYDHRHLCRKRKMYEKITRIPISVSGYAPEKER
jgi:hypothetical protein